MQQEKITLKNVRVHNLKGVNLSLEPNQLIAFTGVSGSGKSSLAFDTIYMEGQRRYVESLSSYARRHLGEFPKPKADSIEGISPTIAIEQKTISKNPRSTVGTITGIYDFLRVLFAKIGIPYCPISQERVTGQSTEEILAAIFELEENSKVIFLSPYFSQKKGEFKEEFKDLLKKGFTKIRLDGMLVSIEEDLSLDGFLPHDVDLVIDRIQIHKNNRTRIIEALQTALDYGKGLAIVLQPDTLEEKLFSIHAYSKGSGISYPALTPQDFSFNHPAGMCPCCLGLGLSQEFDLSKIIDEEKSLSEDFCKVAGSFQTIRYGNIYTNLAKMAKCDLTTPWKNLPKKAKDLFLYGTKERWTKMIFVHKEKGTFTEYVEWKGILYEAKQKYFAAQSESYKTKMKEYFHETTCRDCLGSRLKPYPSAAKLGDKTIQEICSLSIQNLALFFKALPLKEKEKIIASELVKEILERLSFLSQVGLHYLSLERLSPSLSGGEGQRVRLASQIGSGLVGATYILDEPSIGLHPRDNQKLLDTLIHLKNKGNTVIVVEHDEETILASDYIVDVGPLAGQNGGTIVAEGQIQDILEAKESLTGGYLSGKLKLPSSKKRKIDPNKQLYLEKASHHNLQNVSVAIPLGVFLCITGVSGSGKSSLIIDTLYPAISNHLQETSLPTGSYGSIQGLDHIDKIIAIDQSPIGKTPRSNPATYLKIFDDIRDLFTELPSSRALGFSAGRFSFNVKEGCCMTCSGMGMVKIDMDFLDDAWSTCTTCLGKRFDETTLSIRFKGKNIHDILEMTVLEATSFFQDQPKIRSKLDFLIQVGLDYIKLGQPSPTLSGGEAERIKLAKELTRPSTGKTLYILDEPTTGLHFHDINNLLKVLHTLVDKGNTVLLIEHNTDCIKTADWIIDMGPEAGEYGGKVISEGPPEKIAKQKTATGLALLQAMKKKTISKEKQQITYAPIEKITIRGAQQNNLKNLDLEIPLKAITVFTGPSGCGKSSLAFETIYSEGQRRYTDSLSHYARQFVKQMPKPKVDYIEGLLASIAIEQKNHAGNPRSTVGTITEIYDYLRIVYCHLGTAFCPETGEEIKQVSPSYIVDKAMELPTNSKLIILTPLKASKKESFEDLKEKALKQGFVRVRLNGTFYELEDTIPWDPKKKNELFLVVDRLMIDTDSRKRIFEAIEVATSFSKDTVILTTEQKDLFFNLAFTVESTGKSYPPITPHSFSFNTEQGMCPDCLGLGFQYGADELLLHDLLLLSPIDLLLLVCKENTTSTTIKIFSKILLDLGIDPTIPLTQLSKEDLHVFLEGAPSTPSKKGCLTWKGLLPLLIQYTKSPLGNIRYILSLLLKEKTCPSCEGSRLSPLARNVRVEGVSLPSLCKKTIEDSLSFIRSIPNTAQKKELLEEPLLQISKRLELLIEIGLGYLSLDRSAPSLSGGETQRVRLSRQLGSGLTGCLYVLDEPTIGLHPHDNILLNQALKKLQKLGNTLILVEHDPLTIEIADHIVDFGPGSGIEGGQILSSGSLAEILTDPNSLTGAYLSGRKKIGYPSKRRTSQSFITIKNATLHNLKNIEIALPTRCLSCLTGVSGSGKSTLLMDILRPAAEKAVLAKKRNKNIEQDPHIEGLNAFDKLIVLDQNPVGTTIRADISTYTELLTPLRHLYASLPEAKMRGLQAKNFSYNHKKGMCTSCFGLGTRSVSLQFLPKVQVECESCKGSKLNPLALSVTFKEKTLGDVLRLSVNEAKIFFSAIPKITKILNALTSVGLGYLTLGQSVASLSGGESQRLRLSCELSKRSTGKTLYLFDEPSIGLHSVDIEKLVSIFHALVEGGNTVVLIEHHLDLIAQCDYLVDIGPGAGPKGGFVLSQGTPEKVALCINSKTAPFLKEHLQI